MPNQARPCSRPLPAQTRWDNSVLAPYAGASKYANHGQRVVVGQRAIQGAPDIFLGWGEMGGHHFYVRQLRDMKGGADMERGTAIGGKPAH
jgi:Uncharacterized protein conserved in bacteria (DUF2252)